MAGDVAHIITSSGAQFILGVTTARVDNFGNKHRIIDSGSSPTVNTEQFTKYGFNDDYWFTKYGDRFDDPRYYTGDAVT